MLYLNQISSLPVGAFQGLTSLSRLWVQQYWVSTVQYWISTISCWKSSAHAHAQAHAHAVTSVITSGNRLFPYFFTVLCPILFHENESELPVQQQISWQQPAHYSACGRVWRTSKTQRPVSFSRCYGKIAFNCTIPFIVLSYESSRCKCELADPMFLPTAARQLLPWCETYLAWVCGGLWLVPVPPGRGLQDVMYDGSLF
jgi:hypothetical protein